MKSSHQVITCGACSVVVDDLGETTTSIDRLISGIKHLFSRSERFETTKPAASVH